MAATLLWALCDTRGGAACAATSGTVGAVSATGGSGVVEEVVEDDVVLGAIVTGAAFVDGGAVWVARVVATGRGALVVGGAAAPSALPASRRPWQPAPHATASVVVSTRWTAASRL
jgi:hypothetical protein